MIKLKQVKVMNSPKEPKVFRARSSGRFLGFTLVELMITIAVVGILASIGYPSYVNFVTDANRTEGQGELLRFANLQEQYYVDFRTYINDLSALGEASSSIYTENGNYYITVNNADTAGFEIRAFAKGGQATNDSECSPLTIDEVGAKGPVGCWD